MKPETVMWLLVPVFMLHDFEEIILMSAWFRRETPELRRRFPSLAARMLPFYSQLNTASFALAVAVIFTALTVVVAVTAELDLYAVWTGLLLVYFVHLLAHIATWLVYRRYVPVIVTSLLTGLYCLYALWYMQTVVGVRWAEVWLPALLLALATGLLLPACLRLGARFAPRLV